MSTTTLELRPVGPIRDGADDLTGDPGPFVAVYDSLRTAARGLLRRGEWGERSLGPTGLVNEAVVRVLGSPGVRDHADRRYVFAAALRAMRRILLDRARARKRLKRGGGRAPVPLDQVADRLVERLEGQEVDVEALDAAVEKLARWDARQAEVIHLRFLLGMRVAAIAAHLECSVSTVENDLFHARAWLRRELKREDPAAPRKP